MKVLIACNVDSYQNPYIRTLYKGLLANGCDVTCSVSDFWEKPFDYDIVHIQWPNLLMRGCNGDVAKLDKHINKIKETGIKVLVTCHNVDPHYSSNSELYKIYDIVYTNVDYVIHFAEASIELLCKKYPNLRAEHVVIPHHIYDTEYDFNITKEFARKHLSLPLNKNIVVCFGAFRAQEERELVLTIAKKLNDYVFLCPNFCGSIKIQRNIIKTVREFLNYMKIKIKILLYPIKTTLSFVSDDELPFYLAASDIALIHRVKILNSGNLPLAFYAGKSVLGPNIGNVGYILKETNNAVFEIDNIDEIPSIIKSIITDDRIGANNKKIALEKWSVDVVSKSIISLYNRI